MSDDIKSISGVFFYVDLDGAQVSAPCSAVGGLVEGGFVSLSTPVWLPPSPTWVLLSDCPELASYMNASASLPKASAPPENVKIVEERSAQKSGERRDQEDEEEEGEEEEDGEEDNEVRDEEQSLDEMTKKDALGEMRKKGTPKRKRPASKKRRRKAAENTWIYVTGLPEDAGEEELQEHFKKAGILKLDAETGAPRIRLYKDESGTAKGDASLCYLLPPSVELAVDLLDGAPLRPAAIEESARYPLQVQPADFSATLKTGGGGAAGRAARMGVVGGDSHSTQQQGSSSSREGKSCIPGGAPTAEMKKANIRVMEQQALLSWAEGGQGVVVTRGMLRGGGEPLRIVTLSNLYDPKEVHSQQQDQFLRELEQDMIPELEGTCGPVSKITFFPRSQNPSGLAIVKFKGPSAAATCLNHFHGRWFGGRKIEVHYWDGTNFCEGSGSGGGKDEEREEERRLEAFGAWLEGGGRVQDGKTDN